MSHPRPANTPWLSPYITVVDVDKAIKFYESAFKFNVVNLVPGEDGTSWHAEMKYKDQLLMCGKQGCYGSTTKSPLTSGVECPITLYLYCEDIDKFYKEALSKGALSLAEPENMFWRDRMCRLKDPENYIWSFATHVGETV